MHRYVIERDVPGAGSMSPAELQVAARTSVQALRDLGPDVQWIESHVTADRIYCVYLAENEGKVREHACAAGLPASKVSLVTRVIDPMTANGVVR